MAYANRLSLAAPGPGPLAGGRWHKPCPPPGLPPGPSLPLGPIYGGPGRLPLRGLPWGLTGSGRPYGLRAPWALAMALAAWLGLRGWPPSRDPLRAPNGGGLAGRLGGLSMY